MNSKETLQLVLKGGAVLLFALVVIIASAGSLNYGAQPGNGIFVVAGICNLGIAGYAIYRLMKRGNFVKPKE